MPVSGDRCEVIVVGGGLAGLIAAWSLRTRDVVVLEAQDRVGGRLKSVSRGAYWLNLGGHLVDGADSLTARMVREVGQELVWSSGSVTSIAMRGHISRPKRPEWLPVTLPLSVSGRLSLVRVGLRLEAAYWRARRVSQWVTPPSADSVPDAGYLPVDRTLDQQTYAQVLGPMEKHIAQLMRVTANRMASEPEVLSGYVGTVVAMGIWGKKRPNIRDGSDRLTDAIKQRLAPRVRTSTQVLRVEQSDDGVKVHVQANGARTALTCKTCIVAVPAPQARELVVGISSAKAEALGQVAYGPFLVAGLFTAETSAMPWDDLYALATPGAAFCMLFNPASPLRQPGPRMPGGSLVVYAAGDRAGELMAASDEEVRERYLGSLVALFPEARNIVREVIIQRWRLGVPVARPGRERYQPELAKSAGRVHFAGDYLYSTFPGMETAIWSGIRAARLATEMLPAQPARTATT